MSGSLAIHCAGEEATLALGRALAPGLRPGAVVALYGNLGAGKTVLCRGIARGLGIAEPVTSPTFTVVQEYRCPDGSYLFHLDLYRIGGAAEALAFGIEEYLFAPDGVSVVEWPERVEGLLVSPVSAERPVFRVRLEHAGPDRRRIELPSAWQRLVQPLLGPGSGIAAAGAAVTLEAP